MRGFLRIYSLWLVQTAPPFCCLFAGNFGEEHSHPLLMTAHHDTHQAATLASSQPSVLTVLKLMFLLRGSSHSICSASIITSPSRTSTVEFPPCKLMLDTYRNHGSVTNACISNRIVAFQSILSFSTEPCGYEESLPMTSSSDNMTGCFRKGD